MAKTQPATYEQTPRDAGIEGLNRQRAYWQDQIEKAKKRYRNFWDAGDQVIDVYRQQKADQTESNTKDKFNILYSSTETISPNLYAQTPTVRVEIRNKDTTTPEVRVAAELMQGSLEYVINEEDIDELMDNVVEDYLLPGMGVAWVRYEPRFGGANDNTKDKAAEPELLDEMVKIEYVHWQDFLTGMTRTWKTVPWVARRIWLTKEDAATRFGKEKAAMLSYNVRERDTKSADSTDETCEAWEIWDRTSKTVYWYAESYPQHLLDSRADPLNLKRFFPCPRPVRAIRNTRSFVPRALYSQYKSQAETINTMTRRIRLLSDALRVVGLYDGSQAKLADLLNPIHGNRMIAVDSWAAFAQSGGIQGNIQYLPITEIAATLTQLIQAREICKNEIYEVTGFSDIVRGVSKASETLGAQNLKSNWAGARVKKMQREIQRFIRDLIALAGELIAEHCDPASIAMFSGINIPAPEKLASDPNAQQMMQTFKAAVELLRNDGKRISKIGIETDSTLLADQEAERADRMQFLSSAGAFLQQAIPAAQANPQMGPLLGAMLMFTVRTFPSARVIEDEFEKLQRQLVQPQQDPNGHQAKANTAKEVATIKAQTDAQRIQADAAAATQETQVRAQHQTEQAQLASAQENNRHQEKMAELALKAREMAVREAELSIRQEEIRLKGEEVRIKAEAQRTAEFTAQHDADVADTQLSQDDERIENEREAAAQAATEGLTDEKD